MKALIDRHYCLTKWKAEKSKYHIENKPTVLLATCGGSAENNADLLRQIFMREMDYLHCQIFGQYFVPLCTIPLELGNKTEEIINQMACDIMK